MYRTRGGTTLCTTRQRKTSSKYRPKVKDNEIWYLSTMNKCNLELFGLNFTMSVCFILKHGILPLFEGFFLKRKMEEEILLIATHYIEKDRDMRKKSKVLRGGESARRRLVSTHTYTILRGLLLFTFKMC